MNDPKSGLGLGFFIGTSLQFSPMHYDSKLKFYDSKPEFLAKFSAEEISPHSPRLQGWVIVYGALLPLHKLGTSSLSSLLVSFPCWGRSKHHAAFSSGDHSPPRGGAHSYSKRPSSKGFSEVSVKGTDPPAPRLLSQQMDCFSREKTIKKVFELYH